MTEAEKRGTAKFKWTQGTYEAQPPPGFEDYFGAGPLYRFMLYDGMQAFDILEKIRDFPEGQTAEETMRLLMGSKPAETIDSVREAIEHLIKQIDEDPEIEVSVPGMLFMCTLDLPLKSLLGYSRLLGRSCHRRNSHLRRAQEVGDRGSAQANQGIHQRILIT